MHWNRRLAALALCLLTIVLPGCSEDDGRASLVLVSVAGWRGEGADPAAASGLETLGRDPSLRPARVVTSPETVPSLASLMTGVDPERLGITDGKRARLPASVATLAERLRDAGFRTTALIGQGGLTRTTGLTRGFDRVVAPDGPIVTAFLPDEAERVRKPSGTRYSARQLAEYAGALLREPGEPGPAFLWIHTDEPVAAAVAGGEGAASAYREGLAAVDELVRLVHDNLPAFGGAGGARLAVVSTHGLALGERGETLHGLFASDAVTLAPALLPAERAAAADAGVPTFSMTRVAGELLRVATGSTADESGDEGVDLFVARLPRRLYGWPVEAVAVSEAGWLRAGPDPEWHPAGNAAAGPAGAEAAPDAVRARVEEAGITPTSEGLQREEVAALLAPLRRGHALAAAGDVENALGAFREAAGAAVEAIQPRREIVRALMRQPNGPERREALDSTLAEIESLAGSDASRRLELANACLDAKDSSRALAAVRGLADEDLDPGLELSLAEILASAGATEQAVAKIESVASAESEAPELWEWSGDLLLQSGNHYRAREAYEAALASPRGRSPELVLKLGDALKMLGEKDQALIRYAEALRLDPTYRLPHVSAAEILIEKGETERAAHALALSVGSTGDSAADALRRAAVMERHGLLAAASGELEEARAENPENPRLRSVLAAIYAKGGQEEAARQLLDSLRGGGPYDAAVWIEVARADALIGDEEGALAALSEAARTAVPGVAEEVRADPILRLFGDESRLAAAARGFSSGTAP